MTFRWLLFGSFAVVACDPSAPIDYFQGIEDRVTLEGGPSGVIGATKKPRVDEVPDAGVVDAEADAWVVDAEVAIVSRDTCPFTHSNGLGQTWEDCVSLGTHDLQQATKACRASSARACAESNCVGAVAGVTGLHCLGVWAYEGAMSGRVRVGPDCECPDEESPRWE